MDNQSVDVIDQAKLRDSIERHMLKKNISANMMVSKTDEKTQKTAQSLGMSVNHYQIYKRILEKGLIIPADGSNSKDALHMLAEANTTLVSLFPKESMAISSQSEMHEEVSNSMGNPMTGESTPAKNSSESGSSQSSPDKSEESTSSGYSMPESQHMSGGPSDSMSTPMKGNSGSSDGSGEHQMIR